jgi:very-short-patch-repair endonuclease
VRAPILTLKRARALRRKMTLPEVVLWQELRGARFKRLRFRRQHPIGTYILDFYCAAARLAVEIDGSSHDHEQQVRHDERRDRWLAGENVRVLRIAARDVLRDESLEYVLTSIARAAAPSTAFGGPPPRERGEDQENQTSFVVPTPRP